MRIGDNRPWAATGPRLQVLRHRGQLSVDSRYPRATANTSPRPRSRPAIPPSRAPVQASGTAHRPQVDQEAARPAAARFGARSPVATRPAAAGSTTATAAQAPQGQLDIALGTGAGTKVARRRGGR
jgi:hypothetical protein